ncbi:hypothetical protein [Actinomadura chokoriensis]|uniref:Phosphatidylethanolamine-binding protein n=1 Tax=Actinomadura chokoriensis TaxID=454156 RepID=A0ABV4R7R8_9ACTN
MSKEPTSSPAEEDMRRRIHRVGTGASNAPGHLDADKGPSTDDAQKDIEGRIRRRGTGGTGHPGTAD